MDDVEFKDVVKMELLRAELARCNVVTMHIEDVKRLLELAERPHD